MNYKDVFELAESKGYTLFYPVPVIGLYNGHNEDALSPYLFLELSLVQKWLRDEKKIFVTIDHTYGEECESSPKIYTLGANVRKPNEYAYKWQGEFYTTYESALLAGINAALELI